jgi:hypothetical protein
MWTTLHDEARGLRYPETWSVPYQSLGTNAHTQGEFGAQFSAHPFDALQETFGTSSTEGKHKRAC